MEARNGQSEEHLRIIAEGISSEGHRPCLSVAACAIGMTRLTRPWTRLSSTTMNSLAQLVPLIYHERQEEGSMLCAQHALNSLLRTPLPTPISVSICN